MWIFCIQAHTKVSRYITHYEGGIFKAYFSLLITAPIIMELTYFIEIHKSTFHMQYDTKGFWYIMDYDSKQLEIYFLLCSMVINTFRQSWRMFIRSVCLSVHPSMHALALVNILQKSWNLYMIFISDIEWTLLKWYV